MSPAAKEGVAEARKIVHAVLAGRTSRIFLGRIDGILHDWDTGALAAAKACEKIEKVVGLFIDEGLAKDIGNQCAPIVTRESAAKR